MQRCVRNLEGNLRPVIVTTQKGFGVAEGLAEPAGIQGRVDVLEIEQFLATNIYERSGFADERRRVTVEQLVNVYNDIIEKHETDPSLKIDIST